jgi:hypothetical protein
MAEPATTVGILKSAGDLIATMWQRGALLLWTIAAACLVVFVALLVAARWHLGDAEGLLATYGIGLAVASLTLIVFAISKTYSERTAEQARRPLVLIANERQSQWAQARQPSGEVITHITLRFQATNLSDGSVMLSAIRLIRPWVRKLRIRETILSVRSPTGSEYGFEFPIMPHSLTQGSTHFVIDRPVGRIGKTMRIVVRVQDHAGRWYRLVFPHVHMVGPVPR